MALSGLAIVGFVIVHLVGTLKIFLGPEETNAYGEALRNLGEHLVPPKHVLWIFRIGLIAAFSVHIHAAFSLDQRNRKARGAGRRLSRQEHIASTYASRTMLWSGVIVGLFIIFHLADLTWGATNPDFVHGDAYANQIASFQTPWISAIYLVAVGALSMHLFHGLWSVFQSVGATPTALDERSKRRLAMAVSGGIGVGYASMPIAVLTGIIG